ncbi:Uncharacterised protein [Raoultella ornithinolytica]|nr:Uncharacterised protein [Raoultella ornithinolytica]
MRIFIRTGLKTESHRLIAQAVAIFQHQQLLPGQIGHRHAIAICPRVIFVDCQHHRLVKQRHLDKGLALFHQREDRAVQLAAVQLGQQLMRLGFMQVHFQLGKRLVQHRYDLWQQVRANGRNQANMQRPGHGLTLLTCHFLEHFDFA